MTEKSIQPEVKHKPLAVAVCLIEHKNSYLFIKRPKGDFQGFLGMPGGKIHVDEFPDDAIIREVHEECGIKLSRVKYLGIVSERVIFQSEEKYFSLHVFYAKIKAQSEPSGEFEPHWIAKDQLRNLQDKIIPSDYTMITRMQRTKGKHWKGLMNEGIDGRHTLEHFTIMR
jgi:8-oxo-dGTP diphosphatase